MDRLAEIAMVSVFTLMFTSIFHASAVPAVQKQSNSKRSSAYPSPLGTLGCTGSAGLLSMLATPECFRAAWAP